MKFSCGYTVGYKYKKQQEKFNRLLKWHKYFLWYPLTMGTKNNKYYCVWLTFIYRRAVPKHSFQPMNINETKFEYKEILSTSHKEIANDSI